MTTTIESTVPATTTAEKTFTVAGVSCLKGEYKARFANNIDRVKTLVQNHHTDIRLMELGSAMTKAQAIEAIKDLAEYEDIDAQRAFDDFLSAKSPKPPKPAKAPKEPKVKKAVAEVAEVVEDLVETPVDLTDLYESVGLVPPTVYEDAVAEEEVDTEDQPF
jgi:formate dehydrogenase maturation protein FdhE